MNVLVMFDSNYGNTKKIAEEIASEFGGNARAVALSKFHASDLEKISLLIVGSPINGWKPTERMGKFLESLQPGQLDGIQAASFDTRIDIFFHGDAMKKISQKLEGAGAEIISPPLSFMVSGMEGPLRDGELEKARDWAKTLKEHFKNI